VLILASACGAGPETIDAAEPPGYAQALASAGIPRAAASFVVLPLDGGALEGSDNPDVPRNPASTMKLVTTWAALNRLGPAWSWRTEVLASTAPVDGVLRGDLAFRGSGDPALVIEDLWLLVRRIRGAGIREIRGDLLLDKGVYEPLDHDPAEFDGEGDRPYNAGPDALLLNFKTVSFEFVPDPVAGIARIVPTPPLAGLRLPAGVPLAAGGCGDWRGALRGDLADPLAPRFAGRYPGACGVRSWPVNALDHSAYFAAAFRALWEDSGGRWEGGLREGPVPPGAQPVARHESPPLSQVVRDINKFSNNVMTRQLLLTLGAEDSGQPGSTTHGAAAVRRLLAARGVPAPELVIENGSGLSRIERIAPASLASLLAEAWRSPLMPEFLASLPIMGVDGTTRTRRAAIGAAHVKTGQLVDVRAIAGYVHADSGRRYAVVAVINHAAAPRAQRAHDLLLDWVKRAG
jgi:D-alanyl-D-alanine carboxypeptidase/D-alanyl-D-alanine-endopeptidase (penicillin-binding protein 4)